MSDQKKITDPRLEGKSYGDLSPSKATQAAAETARKAGASQS
ncbi:hypothetical protein [Micromonospora craterilacus]|nr:hypothetical protein [Micromonospora craterilacus]